MTNTATSPEITLELVRPIAAQARLIMDWRNDPQTLAMSFHKTPKTWPGFFNEFLQDYFTLPDLPPCFALLDGRRVGFVRFRPESHPTSPGKRCCDVSINIAPAERGKGLAPPILNVCKEFLKNQGFDAVIADCKPENIVSQKAFARAGYAPVGEVKVVTPDTGESCRVIRMVAELCQPSFFDGKVFIIAEAGSNWRVGTPDADMKMAKDLIDVAVAAKADAVKFQTYRPETVYVENAGGSDYLADKGHKQDIRDIFKNLAMPYEMIGELAAYCKARGIAFMSTPFSKADFEAVDPYVAVHKIASYEISHLRLIELAAGSGKPTILSTGASRAEDIDWAINTFYRNGGKDIAVLQCTAKYPAPAESLNLKVIPWIRARFGVPAGLSDHSRDPVMAPLAAVSLGARVIEKHYTLDNNLPGPDHSFAILPDELKAMVAAIRTGEAMLGSGVKDILPAEVELSKYARRGLQAIKPIKKGEALKEGVNIDILRPGKQRLGVHPKHLSEIEGKKATRDILLGDGIQDKDWQ